MSVHRYAAKRDLFEPQVIAHLEAAGCSVVRLSAKDVPDLLVAKNDMTCLVEVKTAKAKRTVGQEEFFATWQGMLFLVRDEAGIEHVIAWFNEGV